LSLDLEVRDVLFHPYRPLVFSSGDGKQRLKNASPAVRMLIIRPHLIDGYIKAYTYSETSLHMQLEHDLKVGTSVDQSGDEIMADAPIKAEGRRSTRKSRTPGEGDEAEVDVEG
jgi:hypothetical protein